MTDPSLFPERETAKGGGVSLRTPEIQAELTDRAGQIRRSALWAAYGDALGWISELASREILKKRTAGAELRRPMAWKRRVGGRSGVTTLLPQGCYSDDTQLRLATGRAICSDGFDVEAFAKVELPVWLSYALGGGKSTIAAATNLAKPKVAWFANTFRGWTGSGGNGAAMRIQPHVWSVRNPNEPDSFLVDVVRNTVCTHSHPTGLMGAVLHALSLSQTMATACYPSPDDLLDATNVAENIPEIIQNDFEVNNYWRTAFEQDGKSFSALWAQAVRECRDAIRIASENRPGMTGSDRYAGMIDRLKLRDPERRGSGMLTAVAAVGLTWCETLPEEALRIAVNEIGTDTDSIATMAGAILGIVAKTEPPVEVLDADMLQSEADRLTRIAHGKAVSSHKYPDLLRWVAPKTRSDALTRGLNGDFQISGLGPARAIKEPMAGPKEEFMWQWVELEIGQTLLIKRRRDIANMFKEQKAPSTSFVAEPEIKIRTKISNKTYNNIRQTRNVAASESINSHIKSNAPKKNALNLQRALEYVQKHIDDDKIIGSSLRRVVQKGTTGDIFVFVKTLLDHLIDHIERVDENSK